MAATFRATQVCGLDDNIETLRKANWVTLSVENNPLKDIAAPKRVKTVISRRKTQHRAG